MSCIQKGCEFESRHCHLESGVSISISHLICVGLRCGRRARLAGAAPCTRCFIEDAGSGKRRAPILLGKVDPLVSHHVIAFLS